MRLSFIRRALGRADSPEGSAGRGEARAQRPAGWRWSLSLLPLLCVLLGGCTVRWSQGVTLVLLGALLILAPPRASLGWKLNLVLAGLAALALAAYLPAAWFPRPVWRAWAEDDLGVLLPSTVTPQPWLTAESGLLFLAGLCWFYLMSTVNWTARERLRAGSLFAGGVVALAGVFLLLFKLHVIVPIWPNERHFGPFPNRNQTADFLAVGSLPVLACAQSAFRGRRRWAVVAWIAGWLVVAVAAGNSFSRAGVVLFSLGTVLCLGAQVRAHRRERSAPAPARPPKLGADGKLRRRRMAGADDKPLPRHDVYGRPETGLPMAFWRGAAVGISLLAILLSAFLLFGGDTLARLTTKSTASASDALTTDFRVRIQSDAVHMMMASPWCGLGLANFASVFPVFRANSALPARAVHPESDWLWMGAELGWPALILALAGVALLLPGIRPWPRAVDGRLRLASVIAVGIFALHSLVDVSTHRLGTCLCALFVLSLALRCESSRARRFRLPARWPVPLFRLLGGVLILGGGMWILEEPGALRLPGQQGLARLSAQAAAAAAHDDYAGVEAAMDRALAWAPLSWNAYFARGVARAFLRRGTDRAAADFRRARYLEPFIGSLAFDEARVWLAAGQAALGIDALAEACRREPARAEAYLDGVYALVARDASCQARLRETAAKTPLLTLPFLSKLDPPASAEFIAACLRADPELEHLPPADQVKFFRLWAQRGDAATLAAMMAQRTAWQQLGWRWWAEACARGGGFEQACGIVTRFVSPPQLPALGQAETVPREELARDSAASPHDAVLALQLYLADRQAGEPAGALAATRRVTALPDAPAYFHYLEASAAADTGDWPGSWSAWEAFLLATRGQQ